MVLICNRCGKPAKPIEYEWGRDWGGITIQYGFTCNECIKEMEEEEKDLNDTERNIFM